MLGELHGPVRVDERVERLVEQLVDPAAVMVERAGDLGRERQRGHAPGHKPLHLGRHGPCSLLGSVTPEPKRKSGRRGQVLELLDHQRRDALRRGVWRERLLIAPPGLGERELCHPLQLQLRSRAQRRGHPPGRIAAGSLPALLPLAP